LAFVDGLLAGWRAWLSEARKNFRLEDFNFQLGAGTGTYWQVVVEWSSL